MKSLRIALVFACLGCHWFGIPVTLGQGKPSKKHIAEGIFALTRNPVSGEVRLLDLAAVEGKSVSSTLSETGPVAVHAALAYDGRADQLIFAGRASKGTVLWRQRLSCPGTASIGTIVLPAGHLFTKMAAGPDGLIYALTTPVHTSPGHRNRRCALVQITPGRGGEPARARTITVVSSDEGIDASSLYSGDMAFSATGDLYIFATAIDTSINYYTGAAVYRIQAKALRSQLGGTIPVERLGGITGMGNIPGYDSTVISGAAFLNDGRFLLSAMDKATQQSVSLFIGHFLPGGIFVEPLPIAAAAIPPGFLISDLASCYFPALPTFRQNRSEPTVGRAMQPKPDDWERSVTIRTFNF